MNIIKRTKTAYRNEGWNGIFRRINLRTDAYKRMGLFGIINELIGKAIWIKDGKYSLKHAYPKRFFTDNLIDSRPMAEYLSPKIVKSLNINSVIDLGCATGHWVNALEKTGIEVVGIEGGDNAKTMLVCNPNKVIFADLREPLKLNGKFDMVISIEVAEHIEHKFVDEYLDNMMRFNPKLIMMTAAIPGQGGEFHVNEQESDYWDKLFLSRGFNRVREVEKLIASFVDEAKKETDVPEIMKNHLHKHEGVYIPYWMPKNLLVYGPKTPLI
jgi:SAM-dependent methyltransferase